MEQTARHPFLADFYTDIEKYKLETELAFVLLHYHQLHVLDESANVVTDFSQGKDLIFARMNLEGADLSLFETLYSHLSGRLAPPVLTVVLDLPVSTLMERVNKRARSYELKMPVEYLERLLQFYDKERDLLGPHVRFVSVSPDATQEEVAIRVADIIRETARL